MHNLREDHMQMHQCHFIAVMKCFIPENNIFYHISIQNKYHIISVQSALNSYLTNSLRISKDFNLHPSFLFFILEIVFIHYITENTETRCCKICKKMLHTLELVKNTFYLPWSLCCFMGMFIFKRTDFFFKLIHAHLMFTQKIVLTISKMTFNKTTNMFKYLFTWNSRCSLEYDV